MFALLGWSANLSTNYYCSRQDNGGRGRSIAYDWPADQLQLGCNLNYASLNVTLLTLFSWEQRTDKTTAESLWLTVNNNSSKASDTLSARQIIDIWLPKVEMRLHVYQQTEEMYGNLKKRCTSFLKRADDWLNPYCSD